MFEDWFTKRLDEIKAAANQEEAIAIEHLAKTGKMLVDYLMLQLNGISITTQPVKKAEPVQ